MKLTMEPIGLIESCFKEKFGIPRQPGLAPGARGVLRLLPPFDRPEAVRGLDGFSHVWLIFGFHGTAAAGWKPTVRPPRLGGNQRLGVFATRSTFRPNPLGLSVVKLDHINTTQGVVLSLSGIDLLDGTPIYDIKPYLPYADSLPDALGGFAGNGPDSMLTVTFSALAESALALHEARHPGLRVLIVELLHSDPSPAYMQTGHDNREFGMRLYDFNLRWRIADGCAEVIDLTLTGA